MSKFRQASKYRHTQGSVMKRELWYPDLKPSASSDFNTIAASANWISVAWSTTGSVALLQLSEVGKRPSNSLPTISAHGADVTDMSFSPYDDNLLATSSDDATVKLWSIPNNNKDNISNATIVFSGHKRRVDSIKFNPTANVLASGSSDKTVKLWDVEKGSEILTLEEHGDGVSNVAWNWNGSLLATTSKDKKLRIFDPRQKQVVQTGESHQGVKASTLVWVGTQSSSTQQIVTAGFSKFRDRQIAFWDASNLAKPLTMTNLDNSTGILDLHYDADTNILFLCGKGDGGVRIYEINDSATAPYHTELTAIQSDQTQKSTTRIPKRACDLMNAEIDRVLKLTANAVVPVTFVVPRKSKSEFQDDLFPPTASTEPALTVAEWSSGETRVPKTIQLKPNSTPWWIQQDSQSSSPATDNNNNNSSSSASSTPQSTPQSSASSTPSSSAPSTPSIRDSKTEAKVQPYTPRASVQVVRQSKFRHIEGKGTKTEQCYVNLQTNTGAANNSFIKANPTFFAVPWRGPGGQVAVIPLSKLGRQNEKTPTVECGSECLDFDFSPFNDNLLATVTESAHLQLWKVPVGGYNLGTVTRTPDTVLKGHTRRVTSVDFHPNVDNIVVTSAGDQSVRVWDISAEKEVLKFADFHTDVVQSVTFSWDSGLIATSCKDRLLRIFDPRTNKLVEQVETHEGAKGFKATYMGSRERICTVGANKSSVRQISVWDTRNLKSFIGSADIDQGAGVITPVYDIDTGVVFLTGKGDGNLKMYEINDEAPFVHYLTEYRSNVPAVGTAVLPKTMCNVKDCEIMRFIKLCGDYAEPLYFRVPRTRMEYFQDDLYPPTRRPDQPVLNNKEWLAGTYRAPTLVSLKPEGMTPLSEATIEKKEKKYDFNEERQKKDSEFNKDKFLSSYYSQLGTQREEEDKVLKQDLQEGVDPSEWD